MRKLLDRLFGNTYVSTVVPLCVSFVLLVISLVFADSARTWETVLRTTFICAIIWIGTFFVLYFQIRFNYAPGMFIDIIECATAVLSAINGINRAVVFVVNGGQEFDLTLIATPIIVSAVAFAHSKR